MNTLALPTSFSAWIDPLLVRFQIINAHYPHLAWLLLGALKIVAIVLLAWVATKSLRRYSARARCWVWRCAILGILASLAPLAFPVIVNQIRVHVSVVPQQGQQEKAYHDICDWGLLKDQGDYERERQQSREELMARDEPPWGMESMTTTFVITKSIWRNIDAWAWRVAIWGGTAFVMFWLVRLYVGFLWLRRKAGEAESETVHLAQAVASELGVRKSPRVCHNIQLGSPLLTGWLRPRIHLPSKTITTVWTSRQLRMVFLHELAHWKRMDTIWFHLGRATALLFWWQPLVALAARRMMREAEEAADDIVMLHQLSRRQAVDYASTLVALASGNPAVREPTSTRIAGLSMVGRKPIEKRIRAILRNNPWRERMGWRGATLTALLAIFCAATITVLVGRSSPETPLPQPEDFIPQRALTPEEQQLLQAIVDANERRLTELRYIHLITEDASKSWFPRDGEAAPDVPHVSSTNSEWWMDIWRKKYRAERVQISTSPDYFRHQNGQVSDGKTTHYWSISSDGRYNKNSNTRSAFPDYCLNVTASEEALRKIRRIFLAGTLNSGHMLKKGGTSNELDVTEANGHRLIHIRETIFDRDGSLHQQRDYLFDPSADYLLCREDLVQNYAPGKKPLLSTMEVLGTSRNGVGSG